MFRKVTIVAVLVLGGVVTRAALADGPGGSGYSTITKPAQPLPVVSTIHTPQTGGNHGIVVLDDGPGLGGGY